VLSSWKRGLSFGSGGHGVGHLAKSEGNTRQHKTIIQDGHGGHWTHKSLYSSSCSRQAKAMPSTSWSHGILSYQSPNHIGNIYHHFSRRFVRTNASGDDDDEIPPRTIDFMGLSMPINIPNTITMTRILSTPVIAYTIIDGQSDVAAGLFFLAGFSDWLDGYIARNWNQQTVFGSFLDPLADKFFVSILSITFAYTGMLPAALVALMFSRDVGLIAATFWHRFQTIQPGEVFFDSSKTAKMSVSPSVISKFNTTLQFGLLFVCISHSAWQIPDVTFIDNLGMAVGLSTVASGADYLIRGMGLQKIKK
jgi:CDP-diacylglycerol--glycerol-3-phosphate 3-phosphatidyltransferase